LSACLLLAALAAGGCGGTTKSTSTPSTPTTGAQSAAGGDIPDNQVFLTFHNPTAGYSLRYPEGWSQGGSGAKVTISSKANSIHIAIVKAPVPTPASVAAELSALKAADPSIKVGTAAQLTIKGTPVVKATYTSLSPPDPVTGKRLTLITDHYEYSHNGSVEVLDLSTPKGVDNVDAYRMISESFKWR
jgi:hypothetical protein